MESALKLPPGGAQLNEQLSLGSNQVKQNIIIPHDLAKTGPNRMGHPGLSRSRYCCGMRKALYFPSIPATSRSPGCPIRFAAFLRIVWDYHDQLNQLKGQQRTTSEPQLLPRVSPQQHHSMRHKQRLV